MGKVARIDPAVIDRLLRGWLSQILDDGTKAEIETNPTARAACEAAGMTRLLCLMDVSQATGVDLFSPEEFMDRFEVHVARIVKDRGELQLQPEESKLNQR